MTTQIRASEGEALAELRKLSNEGRWGAEDERGTLNLLTPEVVRRSAQLVKQGRVYPLGEVIGAPDSPRILEAPQHDMRIGRSPNFGDPVQSATDGVTFGFIHGSVTHVDALCHVAGVDGKVYNGFDESVVDLTGANRVGIENVDGMVTRGVLLDLAGLRGVDHLPAEYVVGEEDIVEAAGAAGVEIETGDAVLLRTGFRSVFLEDFDRYRSRQPGIGASAALHLVRRDVCLIGADTIAVEAMNLVPDTLADDPRAAAGMTNRLHPHLLRHIGLYLLELLNLDDLAAAGVTEFQFAMAPLMVQGGTGSPVNPLAIC